MKKTNSNIRLVHPSLLDPDRLYTQYPLKYFIGRCVKITFQSPSSRCESMWVLVNSVSRHRLVGTLENEPQHVTHVKCGDTVRLHRSEIISVALEEDEWLQEVRLRLAKDDFFNRWRGPASGEEFEEFYNLGLGPAQALRLWRDYVPPIPPDFFNAE